MAKKNKKNSGDGNLVFSTGTEGNSLFNHIKLSDSSEENMETTDQEKSQMKVRVMRDRKQRKGKEVTVIKGLMLEEEELKTLCKELKVKCGAGGTVKEGEIIIQGNFVDRLLSLLKDRGYKNTKKVGG